MLQCSRPVNSDVRRLCIDMNKALTAGLLCLVILGIAPTTSAKKLTVKEKREVQTLADRFIRRLREIRDLRPLMAEFFVTDFRKSGLTDPFWGRSVNLDVPFGANLSDKELWDFYAVKFTDVYLSRLHLASKVPLESLNDLNSEDFERLTPQTILDYSKTLKLPEREPPPRDQVQLIYSIKDHKVKLLQQELAQRPPEETAMFKKNLALFRAQLNDKRNSWGGSASVTGDAPYFRFIRMEIPFGVGLVLVREHGQLKIWFAATLPD